MLGEILLQVYWITFVVMAVAIIASRHFFKNWQQYKLKRRAVWIAIAPGYICAVASCAAGIVFLFYPDPEVIRGEAMIMIGQGLFIWVGIRAYHYSLKHKLPLA